MLCSFPALRTSVLALPWFLWFLVSYPIIRALMSRFKVYSQCKSIFTAIEPDLAFILARRSGTPMGYYRFLEEDEYNYQLARLLLWEQPIRSYMQVPEHPIFRIKRRVDEQGKWEGATYGEGTFPDDKLSKSASQQVAPRHPPYRAKTTWLFVNPSTKTWVTTPDGEAIPPGGTLPADRYL
ncbi:hypothetical protein V8F33_008696 [Rhypophila sp. PSN 637]